MDIIIIICHRRAVLTYAHYEEFVYDIQLQSTVSNPCEITLDGKFAGTRDATTMKKKVRWQVVEIEITRVHLKSPCQKWAKPTAWNILPFHHENHDARYLIVS